MSGFVYLIRNKDLYKIGITQNLEQRMKALKPDEILSKLRTDNYEQLEKDLHKKYKGVRIPQTEYFRLSFSQATECKEFLDSYSLGNATTTFQEEEEWGGDEFFFLVFAPFVWIFFPIFTVGGLVDFFIGESIGWYELYKLPLLIWGFINMFALIIGVLSYFAAKDDNREFTLPAGCFLD